ncbi:hypothetical protein PAESOLCIP111_06401 [Paenibacillus solanacearum]|uniref:Uncharacterized protein n=1 Tax=Paenibacillus solanacearum TaxID=2048548 RepID=A0A916K7W1_9BACL|nr:hypothetical protein [Paenibacillus solanacearum]CAG7651836.1 hypothetical protein PAESOLCIP111_06401 [Paenibacillus solanacearum]
MDYTMAECLQDYYSPLDRTKIMHWKGKTYIAHPTRAEGFYAIECETYEGQPFQRIIIQTRDTDYIFR